MTYEPIKYKRTTHNSQIIGNTRAYTAVDLTESAPKARNFFLGILNEKKKMWHLVHLSSTKNRMADFIADPLTLKRGANSPMHLVPTPYTVIYKH